jgi:hypothetical protein
LRAGTAWATDRQSRPWSATAWGGLGSGKSPNRPSKISALFLLRRACCPYLHGTAIHRNIQSDFDTISN